MTVAGAQRAISSAVKSAIAAADVEPSKILRNVKPVEEHFANETSPATHQPLVGFSISEKLVSLAHVDWLMSLAKVTLLYARKPAT
jgi:hypothetical protein